MDKRPYLTENAKKLLEDRYLLKDKNGKIKETPRQLFERVAKAVSWPEKTYGDPLNAEQNYDFWYNKILDALLNLEVMPASPYLFNCRDPEIEKSHGLFSCFVLPIEDSMDKIYDCMKEAALVYQKAGGVGIDFSPLREKGALVKTSNGISSGPLAFLQTFDHSAATVSQAGVRRSASMALMAVDHPDIEEFINIKSQNLPEINRLMKTILTSSDKTLKAFAQKELDRLQNLTKFNLSVKITDAFMKAVEKDKDWHLKSVTTGKVVKTIRARKLFRMICEHAWKSGDPGAIFIDTANKDNACYHLGRIEATNPCGEEPLLPYGSCLTGDTLITTPYGVRKIDSLEGYYIIGADDKVHKYNGVINRGIKKTYMISLNNGLTVKATSDHMFETNDNKMVEMKNLKVGDKLRVLSDCPLLTPGDIDPFYEMLGWMRGDGCFSSTVGISFNHKDGDYDAKERLLPIFKDFFNAHHLKPNNHTDTSRSYQLQSVAKENILKMKRLGFIPGRACEARLPTKFYEWNLFQQIAFMKGLFGADGSVGGKSNRVVMFHSNSKYLIYEVQKFLSAIGIHSRINVTEFKTEKRKSQYRLFIGKESAFRFMHIIGFSTAIKVKKFNYTRHNSYKDENCFVIESIKCCGDEEVFDIMEVSNVNTFYANGIATHNCNLTAIDINKCIINGELSELKLGELVKIAVQICENAIDVSSYPIPQIEEMAKKTRNIGIGIMGVADALISLGIPYGSKEAQDFLEGVAYSMRVSAVDASEFIAKNRGVFPAYKGSKWDKGETMEQNHIEIRNARLLTAQPTGSVAIIAGASHGLEPLFSVFYQRRLQNGDIYTELNPKFKEAVEAEGIDINDVVTQLKKYGTIQAIDCLPQKIKDVFKCAMDISPEEHIRMQAAYQKYNDSSTSKTINMSENATIRDVEEAYKLAYKLGCKGITVFRDGCKTGVLSIKTDDDTNNEELRNFLLNKYSRENMTAKEIADILDVSESQIFAKLKRFGIKKDEEKTTIQARERKLNTALKEVIIANLLVGNSKINTVENQSSYRQVSDHLVYVQNIMRKFIDNGISCSEIMSIVTDKTYYYFDTIFNKDIYSLPADNDVVELLGDEEVETLLTRTFMRNLFLVGGIKTGKGGIKFCSKHGNYNNLKKIMRLIEKEIDAEFSYKDKDFGNNGIVYIPKKFVGDFYDFIESGDNIEKINIIQSKTSCPQCGGVLSFCEGCKTCPGCGWSACSL